MAIFARRHIQREYGDAYREFEWYATLQLNTAWPDIQWSTMIHSWEFNVLGNLACPSRPMTASCTTKSHSNNFSLSRPINTRIGWYMAFKMFGLSAGSYGHYVQCAARLLGWSTDGHRRRNVVRLPSPKYP